MTWPSTGCWVLVSPWGCPALASMPDSLAGCPCCSHHPMPAPPALHTVMSAPRTILSTLLSISSQHWPGAALLLPWAFPFPLLLHPIPVSEALSMNPMLESLLTAGGQNDPDQDEGLAQQALLGQNNISNVQTNGADKAIAEEEKKEIWLGGEPRLFSVLCQFITSRAPRARKRQRPRAMKKLKGRKVRYAHEHTWSTRHVTHVNQFSHAGQAGKHKTLHDSIIYWQSGICRWALSLNQSRQQPNSIWNRFNSQLEKKI